MTTVTKQYTIQAPLQKVYEALTDRERIEQWSGGETVMEPEGGRFSLWKGNIYGINKKITFHQIIQDWKLNKWDRFSRCTFNLAEKNGVTELELIHEEIPDGFFDNINNGWDEHYLGPLKALVEKTEKQPN